MKPYSRLVRNLINLIFSIIGVGFSIVSHGFARIFELTKDRHIYLRIGDDESAVTATYKNSTTE